MAEPAVLTRRPRGVSEPCVLLSALGLTLLGLLTLWSVTTVYGDRPYTLLGRQALFLMLALAAGAGARAVGYRRLAQWSRPLLVTTWMLLIVVLLMPEHLGARRWVHLGPVNIQPSELAKPVMILLLSAFCVGRAGERRRVRRVFLPGCAYACVTAALVMIEPDLGQTLFILALSLMVLLVNGLRLLHVAVVAIGILPALVLFMKSNFGYIRHRIETFASDKVDFQVMQGLHALQLGGLFGRGLGHGQAQLKFVPKVHNDFVMVAIGEQLGFMGCLLVVGLFLVLLWHGLRIALNARDQLGFSVAFGVTFMIGLQAAVNLAVVTDTVPPKGISLPFVSYGGSSLVVLGASVGILLSIAHEAVGGRSTVSGTHSLPGSCTPSTPDNSRKKLEAGAGRSSARRPSKSHQSPVSDASPLITSPGHRVGARRSKPRVSARRERRRR